MTTLNVNLSPTLQQTLGQKGAYAYAVYFDNQGQRHFATLADGQGTGPEHVHASTALELPQPYVGGKVYFIIQSLPDGAQSNLLGSGPGAAIQQESDINWQNAAQNDFRFDS